MSRHSPPPVVRKCELALQNIELSSDSEFNAHRNSRLQSLLQHHFNNDHNSAWKQLVIQNGIATAADLPRSVGELRNLPIVTKSFLREANYASRPAVRDSEIRMTVLTSGSTGAPLSIPQSLTFSRRAWKRLGIPTYVPLRAMSSVTTRIP
jgi:phenylacetate-coenzyme A ligase PaaK-like adenylate-forming protein